MMKTWCLLLWWVLPVALLAQREQRVGGTYSYKAEAHQSLKEAREAAIEHAKLEAIAKAFGMSLTQNTQQTERFVNGRELVDFQHLSSMEVKGEWIEDLEEPLCEMETKGDRLVFKVTVSGLARALSNEAVEFDTRVLRNGTELRFADTEFRTGDDLYLYFKSPVDGYVAVYLVDEQPEAFCLLPYARSAEGNQPVERNREYIFFSPAHAREGQREEVDEMVMTCNDELLERNQVYVIFSPEPFTKAVDEQKDRLLPRQLGAKDFTRWLSQLRKRDAKMNVKVIHVNIANEL